MPRIIAGKARGTQLAAPAGRDTRPTADRTKEALFSILMPRLPGARFLDLFAGSGQVGLEALSRGAEESVLVERDRRALEAIRANICKTHFDKNARVLPMEAAAAVRRLGADIAAGTARPFDVIFMDPPYAEAIADLEKLARLMAPADPGPDAVSNPDTNAALPAASYGGMLAPDGILVLEHDAGDEPPSTVTFLQLARSCKYGTAMLSFYQNRQEGGL